MEALLINNQRIVTDTISIVGTPVTYSAVPELELGGPYKITGSKINFYNHLVYWVEGYYGWLLATRFVILEDDVYSSLEKEEGIRQLSNKNTYSHYVSG